jgi:N-methylhydantoinase A/oxoprolinase/acetone carboxylase beta subunit
MLRQQFPKLMFRYRTEILREFREYERTSTTVLTAYVGRWFSR